MADMVESGRFQSRATSNQEVSSSVRVAGALVRSVFIVTLVAVIWSISIPPTMARLAHLSTGETMRALLGLALCIGMVRQLLRLPKDAGAYRTWIHIGLALAFVFAVFQGLRMALAG